MASNKKNKSKVNGFLTAMVVVLLLACVAVGIVGWQSEGWQNWEKFKINNETTEPETETPDGDNPGGMVTNVQNSALMALATAAMTAADGAESSTTLTATIAPGESTNQSVDWEIAFVNPDSSWATGKTVTDYVTLNPTSDGALTATVNCLQPFGEQIIVKVISRDNPDAQATCSVDYIQKVSNVTLSFGNKTVNLGGDTNFVWEINENGVGEGGTTTVNYTVSDVYTIAGNYSHNVSISLPSSQAARALKLNGKMLFWSAPSNDITSTGFTLNCDFLKDYNCYVDGRTGTVALDELSPSQLMPYFQNIDPTNNILAEIKLTISGDNDKIYEYTSYICVTGYTNSATVMSVSLNSASIVF